MPGRWRVGGMIVSGGAVIAATWLIATQWLIAQTVETVPLEIPPPATTRPAAPAERVSEKVAFANWREVFSAYQAAQKMNAHIRDLQRQARETAEKGDHAKAAEFEAQIELHRQQDTHRLLGEVHEAIKAVGREEGLDVVTGEIIYQREGFYVRDLTDHVIAYLNGSSAPSATQPAGP